MDINFDQSTAADASSSNSYGKVYYLDLTIAILCSISILFLAFIGCRYKVYKNYSSMLIISILVVE